MSLIDFVDKDTRDNIKKIDSDILEKKSIRIETEFNKNLKAGLNKEEAKAQAEMSVYPPTKLPKINLNANINHGAREKVCFFVNKDTLIKLNKKWTIVQQMDEFRISVGDTNKFIETII